MSERIANTVEYLNRVAIDAVAEFGGLSAEQLNLKASEKEWSVAQCFDHLIVTHGLYFPEFERLAAGNRRNSFWENYSPLSGFFGRFLIKGLDPKNTKRMKTTTKAEPSLSEIDGDIIERFAAHQQQMIEAIKKLPDDLDTYKTMLTSPLLGFVTYSLDDALTFLPMHCERHFDQAKRVAEQIGGSVQDN